MSITYAQWFALLALKHFSPERPCRAIRRNTLAALARRGLAVEHPDGSFSITPRGVAVEDFHERAPS